MESYDFITKFHTILDKLKSNVSLSVKYKFRNLSKEHNQEKIKDSCYAKGKFCVTETLGFDPVSVIKEGLRQICLFKHSSKQNNSHDLWFRYIAAYRDCVKAKLDHRTNSHACFETVSENLKLDKALVKEMTDCAENSSENPDHPADSSNHLLDENANNDEFSGVYLVPAVFLNRQMVKENLKSKIVLSAICEKLKTKPEMCKQFTSNSINFDFPKTKNYSSTIFFSFAIVFSIICAVLYFWMRKASARDIDLEISARINRSVTEYMKLKEGH